MVDDPQIADILNVGISGEDMLEDCWNSVVQAARHVAQQACGSREMGNAVKARDDAKRRFLGLIERYFEIRKGKVISEVERAIHGIEGASYP